MKTLRVQLLVLLNPEINLHGDQASVQGRELCIPVSSNIPLTEAVLATLGSGSRATLMKELKALAKWNAGDLHITLDPNAKPAFRSGGYYFPIVG
jgi:hypothetical protein